MCICYSEAFSAANASLRQCCLDSLPRLQKVSTEQPSLKVSFLGCRVSFNLKGSRLWGIHGILSTTQEGTFLSLSGSGLFGGPRCTYRVKRSMDLQIPSLTSSLSTGTRHRKNPAAEHLRRCGAKVCRSGLLQGSFNSIHAMGLSPRIEGSGLGACFLLSVSFLKVLMSALRLFVPQDLGFGASEPPGPNLKSPFKARGFRSPTSWRWQVGRSPT